MVIALFAALIGPWFVNWNDYKSVFEAQAEKILGHPVRVAGSASATILPSPSLTFTDVRVGDAEGEPMMEVDRFEVTIELMPLLEGEIRVVSMKLERPRVRVVVDDGGTVDWLIRGEASKTLDPEKVVLEDVEIADGTLTYTDASSGMAVTAADINALVEARSLAGPWRVEGSYLEGDTRVPFRFQTGRQAADGTIRVKTDISPARWPVAVAADGIVADGEGSFSYAGTYNLTEVSLADESEEKDATGWRSEGTFRLTRDRLDIDKAVLTEGPPDRPASLAGSFSADLGEDARFSARIEARQLDLDRSLGKGPSEPVEVGRAVDSLVEWLGTLPVPTMPGRVRFNVPAIVVGGAIIQGVGFEASPQGGGWAIEGFHAQLPGQATLDADGMLLTGNKVGFGGNLKLAVTQPATFANWWRGRGEVGAGRLLAPFAFEGHATIGPGKVVVDSMQARIGDASLSGRFSWSDASGGSGRRLLETDITADRLDFVQLRAVAELLAGKNLADTTTLADSYAIKLAAGELVIADVRMRDVSVDADFVGGALTVRNVEVGDLGGAQFSATRGQIDNAFTAPRGHLEAHLGAPTVQGLARIVDRVAPDTIFSRWLMTAAPALSPAVVDVSIEAPPGGGGADYRIKLHASANATQADATLDLTGSPAAWRSGNAAITLDLSSYDAEGLARQAGFDASAEVERSARFQITARGVPKDGLKTTIASDFGGLALTAEGDLILAADLPPSFAGTLLLRSDDVDPIVRMAGLDIPGEAPGMGVALDGRIKMLGTSAEVEWKDGSIAGRPVSAALRISGLGGPLEINGTLTTDTVDLGWLGALALGTSPLPTGDPETPWSQTPFGEPALGDLSGKLGVSAGRLTVTPGWDVANVGLDLVLRPDRLDLDLREGQIAGGTVKGGVSIHNVGGNANLAGRLSIAGTSLDSFIWQRVGRPVATGTLDASANFEATGRSPAGLISALTGGGAINIHSGEVRYVNPRAANLVIKASDLGEQFSDEALTETFTGYIDAGSMSFTEAEGAFAIAAGTVRLKSVSVDTKGARTSGGATIDLNAMTLDSDWTLTLDPGDAEVEGTVPQVGIIFRGPLADPMRTIDTLQLGSYLNIRQEARMQEILSQEEAARVEKERFNRLRRKFREDAERREQEAKEAAEFAAAASTRLEAFHAKREVDTAERAAAELAVARARAERLAAAKAAAESLARAAAERASEARARAEAASLPASEKAAAATAATAAAERATADRIAAERASAEAEAKAEAAKVAATSSAKIAEEKVEASAAAEATAKKAAVESAAALKAAAEAAAAAEGAKAAAANLGEEKAAAEVVALQRAAAARGSADRAAAAARTAEEAKAELDRLTAARTAAAKAAEAKTREVQSTIDEGEATEAAARSAAEQLAAAEAAASEATENAKAAVEAAVSAANSQAAAVEAKQKAAFERDGLDRSIITLTAAEKAARDKAASSEASVEPRAVQKATAEKAAAEVGERAAGAEAALRQAIDAEESARAALERAAIARTEAQELASERARASSSADPISAAQATLDAASKVVAEGEAEQALRAAEAGRRAAEANAEKLRAEKADADRAAREKAAAADQAALRAAVDRKAAERASADLKAAKADVTAKARIATEADTAAVEAAAANQRARVANVEADKAKRAGEALVGEKRERARIAMEAADAARAGAEKAREELEVVRKALADAEAAEAAAKDVAAKAEARDAEARAAAKEAQSEKAAAEKVLAEKAAAELAATNRGAEDRAKADAAAKSAAEKAAIEKDAAEQAQMALAERTAAEAAAKAAADLAQSAARAAKAAVGAVEEKAAAEEAARAIAEKALVEKADAEKAAAEAAAKAEEAEAAARAAADKAAAIAPLRASFALDPENIEDAGLLAPASLEPGGLLPISPAVDSAPIPPRPRPASRPPLSVEPAAPKPTAAATKAAKKSRSGPMNIVPRAAQ